MLVPRPDNAAEPSICTTIIGASVGVVWLPIPTNAWVSANKIVLRRISGGMASEPCRWDGRRSGGGSVAVRRAPASSTVVLIDRAPTATLLGCTPPQQPRKSVRRTCRPRRQIGADVVAHHVPAPPRYNGARRGCQLPVPARVAARRPGS